MPKPIRLLALTGQNLEHAKTKGAHNYLPYQFREHYEAGHRVEVYIEELGCTRSGYIALAGNPNAPRYILLWRKTDKDSRYILTKYDYVRKINLRDRKGRPSKSWQVLVAPPRHLNFSRSLHGV